MSTQKSSHEIEREVENSRASVQNTLNELRERMSPGQLVDEAMGYLKTSGGNEFAGNLGRSVRDNPLPVLLIGAGIGWLMMGGNTAQRPAASSPAVRPPQDTGYDNGAAGRSSAGPSLAERAGAAGGSLSDAVSDTGHKAAGAVSNVAGKLADAASSTYDKAADATSSTYEGARRTAHDVRDSVSGAVGALSSQASDLSQDAWHEAQRAGSQIQGQLARLLEEQPLVIGGIGVALGALLGAVIPRTQVEDQLMGDASDSLKATVTDTAKEQLAQAKDIAGRTYQDVAGKLGDTMDQSGLSKDAVVDTVTQAADQVRETITSAAEETKQQISRTAQAAKPDGGDRPT